MADDHLNVVSLIPKKVIECRQTCVRFPGSQ